VATVHVVLIDEASGQAFGEVDLAPDQLPESFAVSTTLQLGGSEWAVKNAEPGTRAEAVAAGRLRLVLRQVERVDPKEILFSLPTLENALPPIQDCRGDAVRIHEDDWRQVELVAPRFEREIAEDLAAIREVHAERTGPGFRRLHVRERIPEPLAGATIEIGVVTRGAHRSLGFHDPAGIIAGGFAIDVDGGVVYGREDAGRVVVVGAWRSVPEVLADLSRAYGLLIVDWCRATMIRP